MDLTFGNVSVADPQAGVFAIKPSGIGYGELTPEQMVVVDYEGNIVEGAMRPSSDTPTHRRLFLAFPEVRAVVHTPLALRRCLRAGGPRHPVPGHHACRLFLRRGPRDARR